MSRRRKR